MKTIIQILIASLLTINSAQASFYIIECSTASGNTTHVSGHNSKSKVTSINWRPYSETVIDVTNQEVFFEEIGERTEISTSSSLKCGVSAWSHIYTVKAKFGIKNKPFSEKIADSNKGIIEKVFLCEESGNSMVFLENEEENDPSCN